MQANNTTVTINLLTVKKGIWQNSSVLLIRLGGSLAINAVSGILLARWLGPAHWGIYAISLFLIVSYQTILEKGLVAYLIQKHSELTEQDKSVAYTIQIILGIVCLGASILVFAPISVWWCGLNELGMLITSAGIAGFAYSLRSVPLTLLERQQKYFKVSVVELADIIIFNIIALVGVALGFGLASLVAGNLMRGWFSAGLAIIFTGLPRLEWNSRTARQILRLGLPIFVSNLIKLLISAADPILLGKLAGPQAFAYMQVSLTLLSYPASVAGILSRVSFSALARIQDYDEELNRLSVSSVNTLAKLIVPLITGLAGSASLWVPWIYGTDWSPMAWVLLFAAIPSAIGQVLLSLSAPLYAKGRTKGLLFFFVLYGLIYWLASWLFIPHWLELGPPLAMWVTLPLWAIIVLDFDRHCGNWDLRTFVGVLSPSTLIMLATFLSIQIQHWLITGTLMLGLLLWWMFTLRKFFSTGLRLIYEMFQ